MESSRGYPGFFYQLVIGVDTTITEMDIMEISANLFMILTVL